MSRLKTELQFLRKKGALKTGGGHNTTGDQQQVVTIAAGTEQTHGGGSGGSGGNGRCCARCRTGLGRIINRGALCKSCRQRVCKACREYNVPKATGSSTSGGTDWVCTVCYKTASVEAATGEWMNSFIRRPSRQRFSKDGVDAGDIVARGIRRSWTISNPSSAKEEGGGISAERVQVYHQQQSPQLMHGQPMRKQGDQGVGHNKPSAPDDENRPPAAGAAGAAGAGPGNSGLLWEPRDPPLQYSIIPHQQQQQTHNHGGVIKSRLEPRRSASLSQADLATYEGKVVLGRLHPHSSQSPPRPPPPQDSAASRYQEYYETKYEKPVRRGVTPDVGPGQQQQQPQPPRGRQLLPGIDVDTIWKSRWRSTSPPPAPVDDWLPIKPPQLAWAKPVQLPPMVELRSSRKTSRIPLPVNPMANPMARSMSGDMDHMIYLERDMPADARLMFRERTRSIDRGLAQHQNQHPHHHHHQRMAYKTYEEELADYHGRTGSVDRLASSGTHRGRPRTIRMGTQSHQVGRSVPASLERRHNEDRSASSSRRRPESGDSSNSSGTRQQSSSRRGSNSTADVSNSTNESSGGGGKSAAASRSNNVNRVYIDGQHQQELLDPVVLRNPSSSAIRVTMTDTRSLKRPTNSSNRSSGSSPGHPQPLSESSTMPRMSKRHGVVQPSGPSQRVTGVVQPQHLHHHHHHPGTTTVYLAHDQQQQEQQSSPVRHHPIEVDPQHSSLYRNKATTKRIKTDADGQGLKPSIKKAVVSPIKRTTTRTIEDRITHVKQVRDVAGGNNSTTTTATTTTTTQLHNSSSSSSGRIATVAPMSIVTAEPAQVVSVDYAHHDAHEEEEEEEGSMVTMMQDASVQTSETGQDYQEIDEEPSDVVTVLRNRTRPEEEEEEEEMGVAGVGGSDESDGTNEEISRCTQMVGNQRDQSEVTRTVTAQSQTYPNSSDTASEIGGLLDSDKMHPEGDDYKIVFISSDSSKSGDDSLEGSFDNDPLLGMDHHHHHHQMMHSHSRQTCRSSSVHDSESAAGFIDESDWDFFAARGQQQPPVVVTMPIQQQQQQQQQHQLPEPVKPAPPPPPSTVTVSGQTAHSSCGSGIVRLRGLTTAADDSSQRSSFGIESPRTFMMDDFNYGWTSVDETPSVSHRGSTIDDCLPGWSSMVTYASRQVQTDFDASSVSVDFEAETFHSEYETMSHFIRDGPPPPPPPPPAHMVTEHFVPIWQVPASSRSSTHSLHSLLSETTATNQSAAGGGKLRSYFSRSDSKRSSGERSVEELSYHDHILSLEPTSNSFISSLYSPEGMALPGFQEYRDRIFTEIQAYTAKGDWNLTNAVTSPIPSSPELRHPTRSRPGSSNSSWLAGPLLGKINNTYRIRPTGSRVAVAPAAKRWRGNGSGDVSPPAVETTTTTAAAATEVSASAPQIESVHLSQQCSHALPDQQQQLVQLLQHTREEEKQHFHLNGQIGNHASRPSSTNSNICLPSHSSSRIESRASATTTSSSAVPSQSIPSSASSPVDNQSTTFVTVNRLPLEKSEPVALPVHRSSYTSDHSLLCCVADAALQPSSLQRNLSSQRAQVAESSPPWKSGPPHHTQTPPPTLPPAAAPTPTAVGDHSSSPSSSSSSPPPAIDGSVATVAKTSSPNAISTGGPPCPPFPSSVASSTDAAAAIQEPMEIHDNDDDDDVISHCCASPLLSAASCHQHHHHQAHMNSPRAPLPPPLADSAGLDSPPPTPPTLLLSPPLSPGPVGVAFTETSERDDDDEIAKVQTTVDCTPFTYVMPHSYSVNGQQSEKDDEKKKEEKEIMIRSAVLHPNDTSLIAPGSPFGYSAPATPMQDENVTAQDQGEGQQQQQQQHAGHEGKTVETNAMSSPSSSSSSQLASSVASSSRFEVLAAQLPPSTPAGLTQTEGRSRPLRLLSSDSDVTDNDDSCSNGAGGGFDTDTQQETVVQGLNNAAYNDLRQFAIKQSSSQKDVASSGAVASSVQLLDPQSDTDSSSSISSQQPPAKRSSNGGSVTASPVLSDGRSTPRRQYTSYVLIKGGNSGKASTGSSSGSSDHVISDDESGVTVTLPREPATAAATAASIVQVPASVSPTGATAEWMAGEEEGGSDSETNEESGSCVTISGNGVLTDHDLATSDDEEMNSERNGVSSKLAKYFTFELESAAGYTADHSARKQPVVHRNQVEMRSSPDPYNDHHGGGEEEEEEEEVSLTSIEDHDQSNSLEQETLHYESDPSDSRLDSIGDDGESLYSESGASSGDEVYMDQEEELRGYNQRAIDFTLHTILEESCEESDGGERKSRAGGDKRMSNKEPSELEKYFTQGLGSSSNASGTHDRNDDGTGAKQRRTSFANEESEYSDTFSETSSSIYSEGRSGGEEEDETDPVELASSRLEKYFRTNFLGLEGAGGHGNRAEMLGKAGNNTSSDGSESVGSDSEGHPSPEQQRRKKVMKTRGLRGQQMQASGGAAADWSRSSLVGSDLDDGAQSDSLSTDPDSLPLDSLHHSVSSSPSGDDDDDDEEEEEEEEIVMEKTDGQFDTIKRRKKKRSAGDSNQQAVEKQLAIIEDQAAMQQQTNFTTDDTDKTLEALNAQMKTPQVPPPLPAVLVDESQAAAAVAVAAVPASASGLDPNCPRKYQSRDSGFVGSCDDLLNDSQKGIRQRLSSESGGSSDGVTDEKTKKTAAASALTTPSADDDFNGSNATLVNKPDESDSKSGKSVGSSGSSGDHGGSLTSTSQSSKSGKLSRKDSFNNWSSDEETNLMMNKMRAFFRNMVSGGGNSDGGSEKTKPPQLVVFETELTRLMKSVPGINDQQVKEIVEYLSSEDTWSDSYDSSDYTSSDLEAAGAVLDQSTLLPELLGDRSDLQQQISASCQEIIEKFDLDRSPDGSHLQINAVGSAPWLHVGSVDDASNSLNKETAFVYQRLVNSLMRLNNGPKLPATNATAPSTAPVAAGPSSEDPSTSQQQPHQNSPPMIAKVLHHIGNRLVALMHEVSASSPDTTSHSGSLDEDAQSASRLKELRLAAHFEPVTSSPRLPKVGRLYVSNKDHHSCSDDKRSLSTSIDSEDTPTDTEQSPDSSDDSRNRKKNGDTSNSNIKFGFESLHTYEKRMSSSLPPQLVGVEQQQQQQQQPRSSSSLRGDGFASLPEENSRSSGNFIGGSRSVKARLAERARTLEAERRRMAEEQQQQQQQQLQEMSVSAAAAAVASASVVEEDPADEDRFYKKARKLPRFSLFARTSRDSANRDALQSSSSGVSDIAEEKEDEFSGWRSSFESAIAADSRTKLSLEAKRRSAGSASSSELFASTGELLDRDSSRGLRVRGASAGHSSKFSLPNLLERDAVRMARERDRERSASSDVLLSTSPVASSAMLSSVADHQQSGDAEDEDGAWDRLVITRLSSKRRSSVPDTREERGSAEASEPRSTTLPRSATALSAVENELDLGSSSSPSISVSTAGVKKSLSLLLSHTTTNSASETSLNTSNDATPVRSARYRPPGFRGHTSASSAHHVETTPKTPQRSNTPQRAPSAPWLGAESVTPRSTGSAASLSSRRNVRSMLADERREPYSSSPSFVREGLRTSVASSAASGESFSSVSASDTLDDSELSATTVNNKSRSASLSALGTRSDSMASVYSAAGEARYGTVAVRGEIQFGLHYNYRQTALEVFVKQCKDLAPVDTKRNRSDPYAKVYLLPDRSKSGKRKTKVKKHSISPMFEENLKFTTSLSDLENRTLWLTVWHSDMFGRNDFLGEVTLPLAGRIFDDPTPHWYQLQERSEMVEDPGVMPFYRGDMIVALKYIPGESSPTKRTKKSKGALHVIVKEAKGLIPARPNGNIDALCKGTLMPEKGKTTKHKTSICRRTSNPVWNCTFIFDDVAHQELKERALELDIWNHDRLATKEFLGGLRLNLGTGLFQGKPVEWMDASGKEVTLWQSVVERAGLWVEGSVPLRTAMERPSGE